LLVYARTLLGSLIEFYHKRVVILWVSAKTLEVKNVEYEEFVLKAFTNLEAQLINCMDYIPFIPQNCGVISPKFIPIIVESCSWIESILKEITGTDKRYSFKKYALINEERLELSSTTSIFLISPIEFYQPFKNWTLSIPTWWKAYNQLKHDRLNNLAFATYENVVLSLIGLHQMIIRSRLFTREIIYTGWINSQGENILDILAGLEEQCGLPYEIIPCETALFVSPLTEEIVKWEDGYPCIPLEARDFSDRVKLFLTVSGY